MYVMTRKVAYCFNENVKEEKKAKKIYTKHAGNTRIEKDSIHYETIARLPYATL